MTKISKNILENFGGLESLEIDKFKFTRFSVNNSSKTSEFLEIQESQNSQNSKIPENPKIQKCDLKRLHSGKFEDLKFSEVKRLGEKFTLLPTAITEGQMVKKM